MQRGLAVDQQIGFALQHIAGFDAWMRMTSGTASRRNLGYPGDRIVAVRKFDLLQRCALDTLSEGGPGKGNDGQSEQNFLDHEFFSLWSQTSSADEAGKAELLAPDALKTRGDAALKQRPVEA